MIEEKPEHKSSPISLQTYFLEQAFLYDESVRDFLRRCRILMSLIYSDTEEVDTEFLNKLSEFFDKKFTALFVERYRTALVRSQPESVGKDIAFFSTKPLNSYVNSSVETFRKSFLKSFDMILSKKNFRFSALELVTSLDGGIGIRNSRLKAIFLRNHVKSFAAKIDLSQESRFKILPTLEAQYAKLEIAIGWVAAANVESSKMLKRIFTNSCCIAAMGIFLYSEDYSSGKNTLLCTGGAIFLHFMMVSMYSPGAWRKVMKDTENFEDFASSLDVIDHIKRSFIKTDRTTEVPVLEIDYQKPKAPSDNNSTSVPAFSNNSATTNKSIPAETPTRPAKKKTRKSGSTAETVESKTIGTSSSIDCSGIIGYPAIYNPSNLEESTMFPVQAFGIKNFFACIDPRVMSEMQKKYPDAAEKFKKLLSDNCKVLPSNSHGQQGDKYLKDFFIIFNDGEISPCFELKPLGEHGNERLVGFLKIGVVGKVRYNIISHAVFMPHAHQGNNSENLAKAVRQLERIVNQEPVDESSLEPDSVFTM